MDQLPQYSVRVEGLARRLPLVGVQALARCLPLAIAVGLLTACSASRSPYRLPDDPPLGGSETTLLIVADSHDHSLLGRPYQATPELPGRAPTLRSPLVDVGSDRLLREAIRFGAGQGADIVLHLGDAANVSCMPEIWATLAALEGEAPGAWYFTPGSHDGQFAGGIGRHPPMVRADTSASSLYSEPPRAGFAGKSHGWSMACDTPINDFPGGGEIMTKDDAIEWVTGWLGFRPDVVSWMRDSVLLNDGDEHFMCSVEDFLIPSERHAAISRRCRRTNYHPPGVHSVEPEESFLAQRFDVGRTRIIILDTSHPLAPHELRIGLRGSLGRDQKEVALELFLGTRRDDVIVTGHHPFNQLPDADRRWIAERSGRYISAHRHESATLRLHGGRHEVLELNVGSIIDVPSQAVVMHIGPGSTRFRVAGADVRRTGWPGHLAACEEKRADWALEPDEYRRSSHDTYVPDLIDAMKLANSKSAVAGTLEIPDGTRIEDWTALDLLLRERPENEGEQQTFWACQAYYAAEATQPVRRPFGRFRERPNGESAVGGWYRFEAGKATR